MLSYLAQYWHMALIGLLLAISFGTFVWYFWIPALRLKKALNQAINGLGKIHHDHGEKHFTALERVKKEAMVNAQLEHSWSEFTETLHPQKKTNELGQDEVVRWRATALAETFFSDRAIVETPLNAEFFKHLPGILTGIGIIGTFSGLILGLGDFQVSSDPSAVRNSLEGLIRHVGHAFIVSAVAIGLAMFVTWIEKLLINARFKQVEKLCVLLDSMFDAGAGEEYLARLVQSSETAATQSAQIKDALVADLKEILAEMTRQQVEAMAVNNQQLSTTMADIFKEPLERISGNQGEAVNRLLTDVLSSFTAQMRDMFGDQLRGMNDVLKQTSQSILGAAEKFDQLSAGLQDAGKGAVDEMAKRMDDALASMDRRQQEMDASINSFLDAIRTQVSDTQHQTSEQLSSMLTSLGTQTAGLLDTLQSQSRQASEAQVQQQKRFEEQSQQTLDDLADNVDSLTDAVEGATQAMQSAVASLTNSTRDSVEKMNAGAHTLHAASDTLSQNMNGMSVVVEKVGGTAEQLNLAAQSVNGATQAAIQVINDYRVTRDVFASMVSDLKQTVENARHEASLTSAILSQIDAAAQKLVAAQQDADHYLEGVSNVLEEAHEAFAQHVTSTLKKGNADFHRELADATNHLRGAVQDLGDTLDIIAVKKG
ncbi:anti-phage ZorAB system protein ZorA [Methylobacillus sp.]|uniref:anti-phage ZorAB system protein ZorA n=1 Tax=Methylobacillus sp. TaxID=56818 RepID=UPI002FE338D9